MDEITNINTLIETGGSIACIALLVYMLVKYFLAYLEKRDVQESEMRKEILKEAREDRCEYNRIIHEEHEQHSKDMLDVISKLGDNK